MSDGEKKTSVLLTLVLVGAIFIASIGFLGILLQNGKDENGNDDMDTHLVSEDLQTALMVAEERLDASLDQGERAKSLAPEERGMSAPPSFKVPAVTGTRSEGGDDTRSSDDLLSGEDLVDGSVAPAPPEVEVGESISDLEEKGVLLVEAGDWLRGGEIPEEIAEIPMEDEPVLPLDEEGVSVDEEPIEDISDDLAGAVDEMGDYLDEFQPDATEAGLTEEDLEGFQWDFENTTITDLDGDGNPEAIHELKVKTGQRNHSSVNGTLNWVVGYERKAEDPDSDGSPNYEERNLVRYANYTLNGIVVAEGIAYTRVVRNDTDGDGSFDRVEAKHLSYGYRFTLLGTKKSFAMVGELVLIDTDGDGTFDDREGTAVFYYKHEAGAPPVTLREAVVFRHAHLTGSTREMEALAFTRINNTRGETLVERGYIHTVKVREGYKNVVVIAARNNTKLGVLRYVVFNGTRSVDDAGSSLKVTAFAVVNRSLLAGGLRSDALAVEYEAEEVDGIRTVTGGIAAARNESRPLKRVESFILISFEREFNRGSKTYENITSIVGKNVTWNGLTSTFALNQRIMQDADGDANPEYLKTAKAVSRKVDADIDGNPENESYWVHSVELLDGDSDRNPESNHTFTIAGWKADPDSDGNVDVERGLLRNVTSYDNNSNGNVELLKVGMIGFLKEDDDSDGVVDHERYRVYWRIREDVNDDGTQINESSGTFTHEK